MKKISAVKNFFDFWNFFEIFYKKQKYFVR